MRHPLPSAVGHNVIQRLAVISIIAADWIVIKKGIAGGQLSHASHAMIVVRVTLFIIMAQHALQAVVQAFVVEALVFLHVFMLQILAIAIHVILVV